MALTQQSRTEIYTALTSIIPDQAVEEMLSYFPARDLDEPASKDYIETRIAAVQVQMSDMEARLTQAMHAEINGLRAELVDRIDAQGTALGDRIDTLEARIDTQIAVLHTKIDQQGDRLDARIDRFEERMDARFRHQTQLMVAVMVAVPSIIAAVQAYLG